LETTLTFRSKIDGTVQELHCSENGRVVLGRGPDSPVLLDGTGISRDHIAIQVENQDLLITDLSSNGTWINGERIAKGQQRRVRASDLIELPGYEVHFNLPLTNASAGGPAAAKPAIQPMPAIPKEKPRALSRLSVILEFARSFTSMERFLAFVALASIALTVVYLLG
jgi:predicted component of type VI protein secretion system